MVTSVYFLSTKSVLMLTSCVCVQVEMFGVTADETGEESSQLLNEFVSLQKEMFSALELHYRSVNTHVKTYRN